MDLPVADVEWHRCPSPVWLCMSESWMCLALTTAFFDVTVTSPALVFLLNKWPDYIIGPPSLAEPGRCCLHVAVSATSNRKVLYSHHCSSNLGGGQSVIGNLQSNRVGQERCSSMVVIPLRWCLPRRLPQFPSEVFHTQDTSTERFLFDTRVSICKKEVHLSILLKRVFIAEIVLFKIIYSVKWTMFLDPFCMLFTTELKYILEKINVLQKHSHESLQVYLSWLLFHYWVIDV